MVMRSDWPQTLNKPMLANFRPQPSPSTKAAQARARRAKKRAEREGNNLEHLACIRAISMCCLCENTKGIQPHHLIGGEARKHRGVGMKSPDRMAVPLCAFPVGTCHEDLHARGSRHEEALFDAKGMNPYRIADALWATSGDVMQMRRVILAHKLSGSRVLLERKR